MYPVYKSVNNKSIVMKEMKFKERLKLAWGLLFSDKPVQVIINKEVEKEVTPVLEQYKSVSEKFAPILKNLVDKAWREDKGITTVTETHELTRMRLTAFPTVLGLGEDIPSGRVPFEAIRYQMEKLNLRMQLNSDARFVNSLDSLIKHTAAKKFAEVLSEQGYIKYQIVSTDKHPGVDLICWVNTIKA